MIVGNEVGDDFKSRTRLFAFHIALISLGKVWMQQFSMQPWVNKRFDWALYPWYSHWSRRRKTEFKHVKLPRKIDVVSHPAHAEGLDKYLNDIFCGNITQNNIWQIYHIINTVEKPLSLIFPSNDCVLQRKIQVTDITCTCIYIYIYIYIYI